MRFGTIACAVLLAGSALPGEAAAMRLVEFEFEGRTETIEAFAEGTVGGYYSSSAPHLVFGRFKIDFEAQDEIRAAGSYSPAVVDFTVTVELEGGPASAQYAPERPSSSLITGGDFVIDLDPHPERFLSANLEGLRAPLTPQAPNDPFGFGILYASLRHIYFTAFDDPGLHSIDEYSPANLLALADQDVGFRIGGGASGVKLNDLFIPDPVNYFSAEGTITSLTEVVPTPLPAAAWLMLSGLATLVGVRAWPRGRRS